MLFEHCDFIITYSLRGGSVVKMASDVNTFDSLIEKVEPTPGRKRSQHTQPSRNKLKAARHSAIGKIPVIGCSHDAQSSFCQASVLTQEDIGLNFEKFYAEPNKVKQDDIILRHIAKNVFLGILP